MVKNIYVRCFLVLSLCFIFMDTLMAITHLTPAVPYDPAVKKIEKTDAEWKKLLTEKQFHILREQGTERSHTGQYDKFSGVGTYICVACGNPLFSSAAKYDSKTGWPSFREPVSVDSLGTEKDYSFFFIPRTEVHCNRCGGHLGHVFKDGPKPTGLRYCINSLSLTFKAKDPE